MPAVDSSRRSLFLNVSLNRFASVKTGCALLVLAALVLARDGRAQFWSPDKKPETVTLTRRLAPVAARVGTTVRFTVKTAGASIPAEAIIVLQQRVKTLLLDAKAGEMRIVDQEPADTIIECTVTGYEPKTTHPNKRQVGLQQQDLLTWIGNVEASVQVTDAHDRPIVAENLKYHMENDFILSAKQEQVPQVTDKKKSFKDRLSGAIEAARGGSANDMAVLVGQQKTVGALTKSQDKGSRPPTDQEWRDSLLAGMAVKIASLIVPVNDDFQAIVPGDKAFDPIRPLIKDKRWGDVQEHAEKMAPLQGSNDAYRLYLIGLSQEGLGCQDPEHPEAAAELLNKASLSYRDALKVKDDHEIQLADIRVRDSIDHYLEIEHYKTVNAAGSKAGNRPAGTAKEPTGTTKEDDTVADNNALIKMTQANLSQPILLNYVQTVANPKFDTSANGLMALSAAKVPQDVITAVQRRMSGPVATPPPAQGARRPTATPQRH